MLLLWLVGCDFLLTSPFDPLVGEDVATGRIQIVNPEEGEVAAAIAEITSPENTPWIVKESKFHEKFFAGDKKAAEAWVAGRVTATDEGGGYIDVSLGGAKGDTLRPLCDAAMDAFLKPKWGAGQAPHYHLARPCTTTEAGSVKPSGSNDYVEPVPPPDGPPPAPIEGLPPGASGVVQNPVPPAGDEETPAPE